MNTARKIAIANAHLGLAIASLNPAVASPDPLESQHRHLFSPAQRLQERQRRKQLATQLAKQALKKS